MQYIYDVKLFNGGMIRPTTQNYIVPDVHEEMKV